MLGELKTVMSILESIKKVIESSELKEKWQKEEKITGKLEIEDCEILFVIKKKHEV